MIIIMKQGTTHEHVEELSQHIERWNVKANPIYGEDTIVIGLVGDTGAAGREHHQGAGAVQAGKPQVPSGQLCR